MKAVEPANSYLVLRTAVDKPNLLNRRDTKVPGLGYFICRMRNSFFPIREK